MPLKPTSPAKKAAPPKLTESLIAESILVRLGLDRLEAGEVLPLPSQADSIYRTLTAICTIAKNTVITFRGCEYIFIWPHEMKPKQGTQILSSGDEKYGSSIYAQIVLAPKDTRKRAQHIRVSYRLYLNGMWKDGEPLYILEGQGNPTTVLAGNNVLPVTTADPKTGLDEPLPSSSREAMETVNRVLFEWLDELNQAATGTRDSIYDAELSATIKGGHFDVPRAQFCCYLPTKNVAIFLQLLTILYAPLVTQANGMINLADHLGLKVKHFTDSMHRITGIQFQWRHGKKLVVSVSFYDKRKRVAQMRQGKTLDDDEKGLVKENVRFDITIHKRGVEQLIGEARRLLTERRKVVPTFLEDLPAKEFLENEPEPTMWWFERAIIVLSSAPVGGKSKRSSFSRYLVSAALNTILRLKSIVKCTPAALQAFVELDDRVVRAWRAAKKFEAGNRAKEIVEISGLKKTAVYAHRLRLLAQYGIDIAIPYAFYRDLEHYGPKSMTTQEGRAAMNKALGKAADKEEVWRLLQEGITNFFAQLVDVVGGTVASPPTLLPMRVVGSTSSPVVQSIPAETPSEPNTGGRGRRKSWSGTIKALQLEGIGTQSPEKQLIEALQSARISLKGDLSDKERDDMKLRVQVLQTWAKRRRDTTEQQQATRRRNRAHPPRPTRGWIPPPKK